LVGLGAWALSAQNVVAEELQAPRNVNVEPATRQSSELTSRAATADMKGQPQQAVELANQAIRADARNPWPYYDKGMALAATGEIDGAIAALYAAEQRFAPTDRWGKSVAIYGRAHTFAQAGRCVEAVQAFSEYARFVEKDDPHAAQMARSYAVDCRPGQPATAPSSVRPETPAPGASAAPRH
jgi:tetratricopeptide (TPR) repeat protein